MAPKGRISPKNISVATKIAMERQSQTLIVCLRLRLASKSLDFKIREINYNIVI